MSVAATNDTSIQAPVNSVHNIVFVPLNDKEALAKAIDTDTCAVIIEGIQGVAGIRVPDNDFLKLIRELCTANRAMMILDEVQSGYGRSGRFFAHQFSAIFPDIITTAKGMGNGFPIAGVLINPFIPAKHGMLGTTFGGNYLACAAGIAVLDVLKNEKLLDNSTHIGNHLINKLKAIDGVKEIRGMGLMLGIELEFNAGPVRNDLVFNHHIFTGSASNKNTIRLLPPLTITKEEANYFIEGFTTVLKSHLQTA